MLNITVVISYLHKLSKSNVNNQLFIRVTLASESRVSNEQVAPWERGSFVASVALGFVNFIGQVDHHAIVTLLR